VPDAEAPFPPLPAQLANRYVLEERLADGGSAEVWRGMDTVLDRPVAVKVLHRHLLTDSATRERLIREAQAAASLSHPGIVAVYDVAIDDDGAALVLELVSGESAADRLRREGVLPPRQAARLGAEVAEALAHAHERGIVHRDVKASNVLLGPDGEARLSDFGIARLLDDVSSGLTDPGTVVGTLHYLAPEQLRGEPAGPASDIYAVGVLLAELISGEPPFPGDTALAVAEAQQTPPLAIEGAPPELSAIIRSALDPDPTGRPASAVALAEQLRRWLLEDADPQPRETGTADAPTEAAIPLPPIAVPPPPGGQVAAVPAPEAAPERADSDADHGDGRGPARTAALIGLGLIGAGLLVLAAMQNASPGPVAGPTPTLSDPPATPTPTPTATPVPTPVPPQTLGEALAAFDTLVNDLVASGEVDDEAAERLRDAAAEVAEAADGGNRGRINRAIRDLREAIDDVVKDGEIEDSAATSLREAANDIEAAAGR
jgi:serine/threonine-protein kinase